MSRACPRRAVLVPAVVFAVALGLGGWCPAHAGWPNAPSLNVPLCTAPGHQVEVVAVSDGAGGAIVAWVDVRGGVYANADLYARRIAADGTPLWTTNGVALCTAAGGSYVPTLLPDGAGGAIVAWHDNRAGNLDIYAQRISAAGVPLWTTNGVALCTASGSQILPHLATDGNGGAIVCWQDARSGTSYDVYAQRISAAGAPQWAANGVVVSAAGDDQDVALITSDGAGGAVLAWEDYRSGVGDLYAQRISAAGAPQWVANGVPLCTAAGDPMPTAIVPDGAGGAVVGWQDPRGGSGYDVYVQRVSSAGVVRWTADGLLVCSATGSQYALALASDGAGGAFAAWEDQRAGVSNRDVYAQHVTDAGALLWTATGAAVCVATGNQQHPAILADGAGGCVVAWQDQRVGPGYAVYTQDLAAAGTGQWAADGVAVSTVASMDTGEYLAVAGDGAGGAILAWSDLRGASNDANVFAQRVDRWGELGAQPNIVRIHDWPDDEGGYVSVKWTPSPRVTGAAGEVYVVWRQVPFAQANAALARGARLLPAGASAAGVRPGTLRAIATGATTYYWEVAAAVSAWGDARRDSGIASTACDSVAGRNPKTVYMVEFVDLHGQWCSDPDSGYSVDNLAPPAPALFTGEYAAGAVHMRWEASPASDLGTYDVYVGMTPDFVLGPLSLLVSTRDTSYTYVADRPYWYRVRAVDVHGNAGPSSLMLPLGALDAPAPRLPRAVFLAPPAPNPSAGAALLRFGLPRAARVTLALYDQQGRRVRELVDGARPAGEHAVAWDGNDAAGRPLAAGLYFVRLVADGVARVGRLAVVH